MAELVFRAVRGLRGAVVEAAIGSEVMVRDEIDLGSMDERRRFADAVHAKVPAASVESIEDELLTIDPKCLPDGDGWPDPVAIDEPPAEPFPVHCLPGALRDWVAAMAEGAQVPPELPALLGLAMCSGGLARKVEIEPARGWREPVNLYVACLLDPANRKSAVFREAVRPVVAIESELIEAERPEVARAQSERRMAEKRLADAEKKAAAGDLSARDEALKLAEELALQLPPAIPRLLLDDCTSEALERELALQGGRMIVAGAEGGLFDILAGRYSGGNPNLDVFLKGHAGDDLRVSRVVRDSILVANCSLVLCYSIQPEILRGMGGKPSFRGRGLVGRFLYAVPPNRLGRRAINPEPMPGRVAEAYERLIRKLFSLGQSIPDVAVIGMDAEASNRFNDWQLEVEAMLADDGRLAPLRDWGGKLSGLTARLAALLHCSGGLAIAEPVHRETIESAIQIGRWSIPHAEAAIGLMASGDGSLDDARYVLRWLRRERFTEVTRREIHSHGRARFDNEPERLDRALECLVDRGWLRPSPGQSGGPGRPSVRFEVHPLVSAEPKRERLVI